jgi:hypothetical protein
VKIRYYYTIDGDKSQQFWCDWSSAGNENITGRFVKLSDAKDKADYYLEIGFSDGAGTLEPGSSVDIKTRFNKTDWTNFNQENDYSFGSYTNYTNWEKVSVYISGILRYGNTP